jgi:hypothetical protein
LTLRETASIAWRLKCILNFVVYNPIRRLKVREAVGEEIGANCDLSHLFWQGCNPVEVIHFLGKQKMILSRAHEGYSSVSGECRKMWRV